MWMAWVELQYRWGDKVKYLGRKVYHWETIATKLWVRAEITIVEGQAIM